MHMTGAMAPPGLEWTMGKTAATIRFVNEAEAALSKNDFLDENERVRLRARVDSLKSGDVTLDNFETVDEWLEQFRHHRP